MTEGHFTAAFQFLTHYGESFPINKVVPADFLLEGRHISNLLMLSHSLVSSVTIVTLGLAFSTNPKQW